MKPAASAWGWVLLSLSLGAGSAWAEGFFAEDVSVEPEIIHASTLSLLPPVPAELSGTRYRPMPEPDHGFEAARLRLGDIPFELHDANEPSVSSLWQRVRGGFGMADLTVPLVKDWEQWYASRPDYLARMIARSERYLYYIVEEVEKRGMPAEIALLPMIESAFNPTAYSTAHASGIWQFIPSTGKLYGLRQNWWQDERRDVLAATRAALDYLEKLYGMFGAWDLALAAYNWGEGAVSRAIARNEARGQPADYVNLDMPAETRNYVPKLQAVKNIVARPEAFGVALADIANQPYFTTVATDRNIDVKLAARFAEMTVEEFLALNPAHNRPVIRADPAQLIVLPTDRAERFQANLAAHDRPLVSWKPYTIGRDDALERIAARFNIAVSQLREINGLPSRGRHFAGLTILVPAPPGHVLQGDLRQVGFAIPAPSPAASAPANARVHVVRAGDTLLAIARRYSVSVRELIAWNSLASDQVRIGQRLQVAGTRPTASARTAVPPRNSSAAARSGQPAASPQRSTSAPRTPAPAARVTLISGQRQ